MCDDAMMPSLVACYETRASSLPLMREVRASWLRRLPWPPPTPAITHTTIHTQHNETQTPRSSIMPLHFPTRPAWCVVAYLCAEEEVEERTA
jgi:hypothetical protein